MEFHKINLKLLDKQINYLSDIKLNNKKEVDLNEGLLNMLCDIYSDLKENHSIELFDNDYEVEELTF